MPPSKQWFGKPLDYTLILTTPVASAEQVTQSFLCQVQGLPVL